MASNTPDRRERGSPGAHPLLRSTSLVQLPEHQRGFLVDTVRELLEASPAKAEPGVPRPEQAWEALGEDLAQLAAFCRARETAGSGPRRRAFRKLRILLEDAGGLVLAEACRDGPGSRRRQPEPTHV